MSNYITSDSIQLARERVNRAWEHIQDFIGEATDFLILNPYEAIPHLDSKGNEYVLSYRIRVNQRVPFHLRLIAGDIIHNLDSTLDNLWYTYANHKFPVFVTEESFREKVLPYLRQFPKDVRELVCALQPYNAGDKANIHPLKIIRRLSGTDKHETPLILGTAILGGIWHTTDETEGIRIIRDSGGDGLKNGSEIVAFASPDLELIQNLKPSFFFNITLQKGGQGESAQHLLMALYDFVRDKVLAQLEPFFINK